MKKCLTPFHPHVPEGATPKDGPSAGVAMTGEVTLVGKVLPIGGLKEKLIAAYTAKMKTIMIPQKNYDNDLSDIPDEVLDALEIIGVTHVDEVLKVALVS